MTLSVKPFHTECSANVSHPDPNQRFCTSDCDATAHDLSELWSWRYASIPLVAALIGYVTNLLAIQMTFLPLEYIGWGEKFFHRWGFSCGWQGIIPSKAEKMARMCIDTAMTKTRDVVAYATTSALCCASLSLRPSTTIGFRQRSILVCSRLLLWCSTPNN